MLTIKNDKSWTIQGTPQRMIAYAARRILAEQANPPHQFLGQYLNSQRVLVPVPRSSPIPAGALWPAKRICDELLANGLRGSEPPPDFSGRMPFVALCRCNSFRSIQPSGELPVAGTALYPSHSAQATHPGPRPSA